MPPAAAPSPTARRRRPRPRPGGPLSLAAALAVASTALATLPGCSREEPEPAPAALGDSEAPVVHQYVVRGIIAQLPDPDRPGSELMIRHEAVDNYRNDKGEVVGMSSMTMPFPPDPGVSLQELEVGDKVRFTFRMQHSPSMDYGLTHIEPLPADTELEFRPANPTPPPSASPRQGDAMQGPGGPDPAGEAAP